MADPRTLGEAARAVLLTREAADKAAASRTLAAAWFAGRLDPACDVVMPDVPARPAAPELLPPSRMPKRGKAGSARGRFALLHALAHIELNAIDLAWDMVGRFGAGMPCAFLDDWVRVGDEEAQHFVLLSRRLASLGGRYGDLPAHDGLWQAAVATADDLLARLAVVPQVLEARGLDVTPGMIERLRAAGDEASVAVLERIYADEVGHVAVGNKWFRALCSERESLPEQSFVTLVRSRFGGLVKPPFNDSARLQAGLTPDFYRPLATPD